MAVDPGASAAARTRCWRGSVVAGLMELAAGERASAAATPALAAGAEPQRLRPQLAASARCRGSISSFSRLGTLAADLGDTLHSAKLHSANTEAGSASSRVVPTTLSIRGDLFGADFMSSGEDGADRITLTAKEFDGYLDIVSISKADVGAMPIDLPWQVLLNRPRFTGHRLTLRYVEEHMLLARFKWDLECKSFSGRQCAS